MSDLFITLSTELCLQIFFLFLVRFETESLYVAKFPRLDLILQNFLNLLE